MRKIPDESIIQSSQASQQQHTRAVQQAVRLGMVVSPRSPDSGIWLTMSSILYNNHRNNFYHGHGAAPAHKSSEAEVGIADSKPSAVVVAGNRVDNMLVLPSILADSMVAGRKLVGRLAGRLAGSKLGVDKLKKVGYNEFHHAEGKKIYAHSYSHAYVCYVQPYVTAQGAQLPEEHSFHSS